MSAIQESRLRTASGAMLYDARSTDHPSAELFELDFWQRAGAVESAAGGRGTVAFIQHADQRWVLRHYRRGGLVARVVSDRYLWTGEDRTRSFREWRLLRQLDEWQLPVPQPVAARYQRAGLLYTADLRTAAHPTRTTLAARIRAAPLESRHWADVGRCIGRFHARGVQHADLNAHNVLLGASDEVYLLDFDRGRIRERGAWEQVVLARLRRSLEKVSAGLPRDRFTDADWQVLLAACAES